MTLEEKIQLIEGMILENPDCTIRDFAELVNELNAISTTSEQIPAISEQIRAITEKAPAGGSLKAEIQRAIKFVMQ